VAFKEWLGLSIFVAGAVLLAATSLANQSAPYKRLRAKPQNGDAHKIAFMSITQKLHV